MNFKLRTPIAILGFGTEGQAALEFLNQQGLHDITICDQNEKLPIPKSCQGQLGKHYLKDLNRFKTVIRSPGVPFYAPEIQEARRTGVHFTSMTWLTMEVASERTTAITGSNGKTTTTALTAEILGRHYGKRLIVGGNDRTPILTEALHRPNDPILLEASSFQFIDLSISPYITAILNITPNHMDWHATMNEYIAAKQNLVAHQLKTDWAILNVKDENTARLMPTTPSQLFVLGERMGDHWAVWNRDQLIVSFAGKSEVLLTASEFKVKTHPINLLCAAAIGVLHQVLYEEIRLAMTHFKGVPQRLEFVRTVGGVSFYDDSSCTTPESVLVALEQFDPHHLILLLGGSSKNSDFGDLAEALVAKKVRVVLYGKEGERIQKALQQVGGEDLILTYDRSGDFQKIVEGAYKKAQSGDNVVLSPACASFDLFKNSKERGKLFDEIVMGL